MPEPVKVLTLWQPFADAVFWLNKWCENRGHYRAYRGPLYIHAGGKLDTGTLSEWREHGIDLRQTLPLQTGAIIGRVQLLDCVPSESIHRFAPKKFREEQYFGKVDNRKPIPPELATVANFLHGVDPESWQFWTFDEYVWVLTEPQLLAKPVPATGQLGIWNFPWSKRLEAFA